MRDPRASLPCRQAPVRASVPAVPDPAHVSDADLLRAKSVARQILRRAGIAPLVPALVALLLFTHPNDARAEVGGASPDAVRVTATATARATILPSSARLQQGAVQIVEAGDHRRLLAPQVRSSIRSCDPPARPDAPPCRMIVYDLP